MEFAVGNIRDIQWGSAPFGNVRIPDEKKAIVQALTESYLNRGPDDSFDDFIEGKGRGLVFLLQYAPISRLLIVSLTSHIGPPGVGKTLTAEAIAESHKTPLYGVSLLLPHPFQHLLTQSDCCWRVRYRIRESGGSPVQCVQG